MDGYLARTRGEMSELGGFLDPIADKLLLLAALILLGASRAVAPWMLVAVLTREVVVVGGWLIRYILTRDAAVRPSALGKGATLAQLVSVVALLLARDGMWPSAWAQGLLLLAIITTSLSGFDYLYHGLKELGPR